MRLFSIKRLRGISLPLALFLIAALSPSAPALAGSSEHQASGQLSAEATANASPGVVPVPQEPGELVDLRTRTSRTFLLADGRYQAEFYPGSIHFRDQDRTWQPIDNTLVPSSRPGYAFENRANWYKLLLPSSLGAAPIRVEAGDDWVSFSLQGAAGPGTFSDQTATYAEALPGVTVTYMARNDSVKESITLASPAAVSAFAFDVDMSPGLVAHTNEAGGIDFVDASGEGLLSFAPPFMHDSSGSDVGVSQAVSFALDTGPEGLSVTLAADPGWLADPARQWPVTIDPTTLPPFVATRDCHISSGSPTQSYCQNSPMRVGQEGGSKRRMLLKFDLSSFPTQANVHTADLALWVTGNTTNNTLEIEVRRITESWTNSVTWNSAPGFGSEDFDVTSTNGSVTGWQHWYPTRLVQHWADDRFTNYGFLLKEDTETETNLIDFASIEGPNPNRYPKLTVTYSEAVGERKDFTYDRHRLNDRMELKVNVGNGNLMLQGQDVNIAGTGLDLAVTRTFNALSGGPSDLGTGWFLSPKDIRLEVDTGGHATFYGPSGLPSTFTVKTDGTFTSPTGIDATLEKQGDNTYLLKWHSKEQWKFDTAGKLQWMEDKNDNRITLNYVGGLLTTITDTQGRTTTFTYAGTGPDQRIELVRDEAGGRNHDYAYSNGQLTSVAVTSHKFPDTSNLNMLTKFCYNAGGDVEKIIDPRNTSQTCDTPTAYTEVLYDLQGRVDSVTRVTTDPADINPRTDYDYFPGDTCPKNNVPTPDVAGKTEVIDARANKTKYCWNKKGEILKVIDAKGNDRSKTFTNSGNVETYIEANVTESTAFSWSAIDNLTQVQLPTLGTATLTYNEASSHPHFPDGVRDFATTKTGAYTWAYEYDQNGDNLIRAKNVPLGITFEYDYNTNGTLKRIDPPPIEADPAIQGNDTLFEYDPKGNLTEIDPPGGNGTLTFTYDENDDADDVDLSRVATITDGESRVQTFTYDAYDRVTKIVYQDGQGTDEIRYEYDANGNMESRFDNTGTTGFTFDDLNRMRHEAPQSPDANIDYEYDLVGNLTRITTTEQIGNPPEEKSVSYTYDAVNLVDSVTDQHGRTTSFTYNDKDLREKTIYPVGVTMETKWDKSRRLQWIVSYPSANRAGCIDANGNPKTGTGCHTMFDYVYTNPDNGLDTKTRYSVIDRDNEKTDYRYDEIGRLKTATTLDPPRTTTLAKYEYLFEGDAGKRGNITKKIVTGTMVPNETVTYTYSDANELLSDSSGIYSHDLSGNMTSNARGVTFHYNRKNQTDSMTPLGANAINMEYADATQDRRVRTWQQGPGGDERMSYHLLGLYSQGPNNGSPHATWWVRDNDGTLVSQVKRNITEPTYYYLFDGLGSVAALADESGQVAARYDYEPYGKQTSQEPGVSNPWRYASGYFDSQTKLLKFGTRYYDPGIMRWTQLDPMPGDIKDPRTLNLYAYVSGDPVNYADPDGRFFFALVAIVLVVTFVAPPIIAIAAGLKLEREDDPKERAKARTMLLRTEPYLSWHVQAKGGGPPQPFVIPPPPRIRWYPLP
jgi:RHS repeat-associated protein